MQEKVTERQPLPSLMEGVEGGPLSVLQKYFGYNSFRGIQQDIIESILAGRDTLGLMPTGGGKSITFQVPALAQEGLCLVISPLIALMKDQVEHLRKKGIKAAAVYTGMTRDEVIVALENCIFGHFKFLYVSPERLSSELFQNKLRHMKVSFITVDEAHCISQWGYDFRPSYTQIAKIRKLLPHAPVLALTATATPAVVTDIQKQLAFREENVKRMSFARPNIVYSVRHMEHEQFQEAWRVLNEVDGSAIIYTRSRLGTRDLAQWLVSAGVSATFYHAGLTNKEKTQRQTAWQEGTYRVMVATNAFGMGIDKPDVRLVLHTDIPDSPEAYFQEAGRAGRDGQLSHAVLLCDRRSEGLLRRRIEDTYPPEDYVAKVYEDACCFLQMAMGDGFHVTREFDLANFCRAFKHFPVRAYNALQLLSRAGYIEWTDAEENSSRIMMTMRRDDLYSLHLNPKAERVLQFLLRTQTGLFSDYVFIDEEHIAASVGLAENEVSEQLVMLSRMGVLTFIPRKFIPYLTFLTRRVEREDIVLPTAIYEQRKRQMAERIETMIGFLHATECRSTYLLRYFGETEAQPCGQCDNCLEAQQVVPWLGEDLEPYLTELTPEQIERIHASIVEQLQTNGPTRITSLKVDNVPDRVVAAVLHRMMEAEEIESQKFTPIVALKHPVRTESSKSS